MEQRFRQAKVALNVILLLLLFSCAQERRVYLEQDRTNLEQKRTNLETSNAEVHRIQSQSSALLSKGEFQGAIDLNKSVYHKYQAKKTFTDQYFKTILAIKTAADRAYSNGDFSAAGNSYAILLHDYEYYKNLPHEVPFDRELLRERIQECRTQLFNKGLQQYRSGSLENAVSTWQSLIDFIPDDEDTRRALNTASEQLTRLQKIERSK